MAISTPIMFALAVSFYDLPVPSRYADDFLFCKHLSLVPGRNHHPQQQRWFYESYTSRLARYLDAAKE